MLSYLIRYDPYLIRYDPYLILSYLWWAVFAQNNTEVVPMSDNVSRVAYCGARLLLCAYQGRLRRYPLPAHGLALGT